MCRSGLSGFQLNWVAAGFWPRHEEVGGRPQERPVQQFRSERPENLREKPMKIFSGP